MQATIFAAVLLLGGGQGEPIAADGPTSEPQPFYAAAPRPYAPSITLYYPSPSYDCYSHGFNGIECYPSFRERHYRRPYNYRVKFDYPWHEDVYRNWPDACVGDDVVVPYVAEAHKAYSGPRRGSSLVQRDEHGDGSRAAGTRATTLGDAPLPPPRTLR